MAKLLEQPWWSLALRGAVAIALGLIIFLWPGFTVELLLVLFGIYCLVDGAWLLIGVLTKRQTDQGWWLPTLEGLASILLGIATLVWPGLPLFLLIYFVAIKALLMAAFNIYMGIRLISAGGSGWQLLLTGIVAAIFGLIIFFIPESVLLFLGLFALFAGVVLIVLAIQVHSWAQHGEPPGSSTPA